MTRSATARGNHVWPKTPPPLTTEQLTAREQYMKLWHEELPQKYAIIEHFNHGFPAIQKHKPGSKTLEIGAGLGGHLSYERADQNYHCLEMREEFCREIRKVLPEQNVVCGSIEERQPWPDGHFDRVVAIHVLEHLRNLPVALNEIERLLAPDGVFDIVIPCEGGAAHTFARKISAERLFRKTFKMDFAPIHHNEHVNTFPEIKALLDARFRIRRTAFFPLVVPLYWANLVTFYRVEKK